jgi:hypothetical protein
MCSAFLLILQAGKSGLTMLPPFSPSGKPNMEAAAPKLKEDG